MEAFFLCVATDLIECWEWGGVIVWRGEESGSVSGDREIRDLRSREGEGRRGNC